MSKKEIEETRLHEAHFDEIVVVTKDQQKYTFLELPWLDKPVFSHRFVPNPEEGKEHRTYTNRLPESVKEFMQKTYGGYFLQSLTEK